jgi:Flp pilus assembly pilin Flp
VVTSATAGSGWLAADTHVFIAVELPYTGNFGPRVLECTASILRVRSFSSGIRIVAKVHRMTVINREPKTHARSRVAAHSHATDSVSAVAQPHNVNPVIRRNHQNNFNSKLTGEQTMTFLKNFFVEEDGQDMVEYGLVISLVVIGAVGALTTFNSSIKTALGSVGTAITNNL